MVIVVISMTITKHFVYDDDDDDDDDDDNDVDDRGLLRLLVALTIT
jgi:hypothetical protein